MWILRGVLAMLCLVTPLAASDDSCRPLSAELNARVTEYLAHRIVSQSGGVPSIQSASLVPGTCYYELLIKVTGTVNPITVYLTPDQRFLTTTLDDLTSDPDQVVEQLLMRDDSPRLSGHNVRVTLVEFADLQCPYCKRFADWYNELPADILDGTTLVFKQLPLAMHSWSETAAGYAACANQQSTEGFWRLVTYLYSHQNEITPENIGDRVSRILANPPSVDAQKLISCVTGELGKTLVSRDVAVARELGVHETPTLFIDGRRIAPLRSEGDLRLLLQQALRDHSAGGARASK